MKNKINNKIMKKKTKEKTLIWLVIIIAAINLLLVIGFLVYLYFWIVGRS